MLARLPYLNKGSIYRLCRFHLNLSFYMLQFLNLGLLLLKCSRNFTLLYYNDHLKLTKTWWVHDVQILQLELTASNEWPQTMHACMHSACLCYPCFNIMEVVWIQGLSIEITNSCNLHLVVNLNLYCSPKEKLEFTSILRFALCTQMNCKSQGSGLTHITYSTRAEILMIFWRYLSKIKIVTVPKY